MSLCYSRRRQVLIGFAVSAWMEMMRMATSKYYIQRNATHSTTPVSRGG
jgi:hypothetical protein